MHIALNRKHFGEIFGNRKDSYGSRDPQTQVPTKNGRAPR